MMTHRYLISFSYTKFFGLLTYIESATIEARLPTFAMNDIKNITMDIKEHGFKNVNIIGITYLGTMDDNCFNTGDGKSYHIFAHPMP